MSVSYDEKRGSWTVQCWFRDWRGTRHKKTKRGFRTKTEAKRWERAFADRADGAPTMALRDFYELYEQEMRPQLKRSTWSTKKFIIESKILPYLGDRRLNEITGPDILMWENQLMAERTPTGEPYSQTYLHTVSNQLSALLNHAVRLYGLPKNPMLQAGKMGSKDAGEMQFWTREEYLRFSREVMDKPESFMAFELLYWTGIREGELLALTPSDFDLASCTLRVNKTYSRMNREDVITAPKTPKSVRRIVMPQFLADEVADHLRLHPEAGPSDRVFTMTKYKLWHEMERGSSLAGVKRIRIHDLRHSHVSLLIEMGYSPLAIAERMGHESKDITLRYAHLFPNKQHEMAGALDALGREDR